MEEKKYEAFDLLNTICDDLSQYKVEPGFRPYIRVTLELPSETFKKFKKEFLKVHPSANLEGIAIAWFKFVIKESDLG